MSEGEVARMIPFALNTVRRAFPKMDADQARSAVNLAAVQVLADNLTAAEAGAALTRKAKDRAVEMIRVELGHRGQKVRPVSLFDPDADYLEGLTERRESGAKIVERADLAERVNAARRTLCPTCRKAVDLFVSHDKFVDAVRASGVCATTFRERLNAAFDALRPLLRGVEP